MIRVVIQAGFGNQLFQYATAYSLARNLNLELELDVSFYDDSLNTNAKNTRFNNLKLLQLENPIYFSLPNSFSKYKYITKIRLLQHCKLNGKRVPILCENVAKCREDQSYLFKKISNHGAVLYGFWQNTCYFKQYQRELNKQFRPNYKLDTEVMSVIDRINSCNAVGVHIRRGDFVDLGWNKDSEYYDNGMNYFRKNVKGSRFFIVSDDPEWAKRQYGGKNDIEIIDFSTKNKDVDEFFVLSSCAHQLISESTFGWWAAFLNLNKNKIVIVPKEAKGEIFQKQWIRL